MDTSHLISTSIAPVALISACGLVTLALYNRLGAILARIRAFHQQKIALLDSLHEQDHVEQRLLLDMLDSQIKEVIVKAKVIQKSLFCLLGAMSAFLLCSVFAGTSVYFEPFGFIALVAGFLGISLFLFGIGLAMRELSLSLIPLEEENAYLQVVEAHRLAKPKTVKQLKIAETA